MTQLQEGPAGLLKEIPIKYRGRGLNWLIDIDKKGEAQRIPSTLDKMQASLAEGIFAQLPGQLIQRLGIEQATLVQIDHPLSTSLLYLGAPEGMNDRVSATNATVVVELELKTTELGRGNAFDYYPNSLHVAGIEQTTKRPIGLEYQVRNPGNWRFQLENSPPYLEEMNIGVTVGEIPEANLEYRESRITTIPTITDKYYRDLYTAALITAGMIPQLPSGELAYLFALKVSRVPYSGQYWTEWWRQYQSRAGIFHFSGITEGTEKQSVAVRFAPGKDASLIPWEIELPNKLDKVQDTK